MDSREFPECVKCEDGVLVPLSDYGPDGASLKFKAWACTNPSLGRGITMGLMHAAGTREVVRRHLDDPLALARAHDEMTERRLTPWYRNTVELDRARAARLAAAATGQALPEPGDPAARVNLYLPRI